MESRFGYTTFSGRSYADLASRLEPGRPDEVKAAAEKWLSVADLLYAKARDLEDWYRGFGEYWDGPNQKRHAKMVSSLVDAVRQLAWTANQTYNRVMEAAEALARAQKEMASLAPPGEIPQLDEAIIALAYGRQPEGLSWEATREEREKAIKAVQAYQKAVAAAGPVNVAAVAILEKLRGEYLDIKLPQVPKAADPPTIGPDGSPIYPPAPAGSVLAGVYQNGVGALGPAPSGLSPSYVAGYPGLLPGGALGLAPPGLGAVPSPIDPIETQSIGGDDAPYDIGSFDSPALGGGSFGPSSIDGGSFGGGGFGGEEPVRAVGYASLAVGAAPAAAAAVGAAGAGVATAGGPIGGFFPPMMGGFGGAGELGGLRAGGLSGTFVPEDVAIWGVNVEHVNDVEA
jgi:hypothetical protein